MTDWSHTCDRAPDWADHADRADRADRAERGDRHPADCPCWLDPRAAAVRTSPWRLLVDRAPALVVTMTLTGCLAAVAAWPVMVATDLPYGRALTFSTLAGWLVILPVGRLLTSRITARRHAVRVHRPARASIP